jgi:hypothetical protein
MALPRIAVYGRGGDPSGRIRANFLKVAGNFLTVTSVHARIRGFAWDQTSYK